MNIITDTRVDRTIFVHFDEFKVKKFNMRKDGLYYYDMSKNKDDNTANNNKTESTISHYVRSNKTNIVLVSTVEKNKHC